MSDTADSSAGVGIRRWEAPEHAGSKSSGFGPLTASRLAEIEEQAYADGLNRGLEEGRKRGEKEMRDKAAGLEQLIAAIEPTAAVLDETMLEQLADLILAISRQLIRRELKAEPGEVVRVVREALAVLPVSESEIRIVLNPEDAVLVGEILKPATVAHPIRITEDLSMSRGGARVETDVSVVDATVEARFGAIAANVFGDDRLANPGRDEQ